MEIMAIYTHTQNEQFDDISFDETDGETFVQICQKCNDKLDLKAWDDSVCSGLICSVRDCQHEADYYLVIESIDAIYFGERKCLKCGQIDEVETSTEPLGVWEVAECDNCASNRVLLEEQLQNEFHRTDERIETRVSRCK